MKGPLSVDLQKYTDRNMPSDDCKMVLFSKKKGRLFVALTLLSASVLLVTGDTLFYRIIQLEVSYLMHFLGREIFLPRFDRSHTVGTHY